MKRSLALLIVVAVACACPSKPNPAHTGTGSGSASGSAAVPPRATGGDFKTCDDARTKLTELYAAEPTPARNGTADTVSDNVTMVMNDCKKAQDRVLPCLAAAATVKDIEAKCVLPLDDEGTEGEGK